MITLVGLIEAVHDALARLTDRTHRLLHWSHDRAGGRCTEPECPICGAGELRCRRCWDYDPPQPVGFEDDWSPAR